MPWAILHRIAYGVVVPNITLTNAVTLTELNYKTGGEIWPIDANFSLVVCASINVSNPIMQPNNVPVPYTPQFVRHLANKKAASRVTKAVTTVRPLQWWPDKDQLVGIHDDVGKVLGGVAREEWYERIMVVRSC